MTELTTNTVNTQQSAGFKIESSQSINFDVESNLNLQAQALSMHQGQIQGLAMAVQSVQSSLNFWQTTALGVGALILAALGVLVTFQIKTSDNIVNQDNRFTELERKVDVLPSQISDSLRSTSRDLVLISQSTRHPIEPPEDKKTHSK